MVTPIPYIREFEFSYGVATPISPNVRRLVANNPGRFSGWGTNVYIIGTDELIVVDPGPNTDRHFEVLTQAIGTAKVMAVFVTHHHLDHSPMAPRLAAHFDCQTHGFGPPNTMLDGGGVRLEAGDDVGFSPQVRVKDGQIFTGNGWELHCVHTPGHTSNHMCYAVQPDNGLICGDHVMAWSTSVVSPPDGSMSDYLHSLTKVQNMNFAHLWPGHGSAIDDPHPFLSAYLEHRAERDRQILLQLRGGIGQIKSMVPDMYAQVDKRLHPAACHSVLSHLIRMIETGQVTCHGTPGINSEYRLI
ncbi:MAG: MBL fold metallo-hydrolase [Robiginitomaculum sp.]|nr:MBL fold metallo-hydrolase [Robiginitomaculum sp.]